jgi:UPF0042 nucleotide-binding protein
LGLEASSVTENVSGESDPATAWWGQVITEFAIEAGGTFERWLVDSGMATAAEMGVYGPEGQWLIEGHGVDPDIVVDNLPPALIPTMVDLGARSQGNVARIAVVVDVRGRRFFDNLRESLADLEAKGVERRVLFLEASDDTLVRRFESVRRPHPLQGDGRIVDGIEAERELLRELRGDADLVIDTSSLNVHELRAKMDAQFAGEEEPELRATVMSFGFKYGLPVDADLVVDMRFLPNPHWIPELRPRTGLDPEVADYVLGQQGATEFVERWVELIAGVAEGYLGQGKRFAQVAIGCTGGKHRSVTVTEEVVRRLQARGIEARAYHRDLGRE